MYRKIKNIVKNLFKKDRVGEEFVPYKKSFRICEIDFELWIADSTGKKWYDHDYWNDAPELQMLNKLVERGDHVLEFGLHHGFISTFTCIKVGNKGKYIGVELLPKASIYTMANLKLNEIGPNCKIINAAGGDKAGFISFFNEENANGYVKNNNNGFQIEQITGDSLLERLDNRVDCLKIDVEGFEIKVLEGCKKILDLYPNIDLEIHTESIKSYEGEITRIFELINIEKYDAYYFWNPGTQYIDPTSHKLKRFSVKDIPASGIVNLFLFSKEKRPVEIVLEKE
jgi:FkbM family methyltransferase